MKRSVVYPVATALLLCIMVSGCSLMPFHKAESGPSPPPFAKSSLLMPVEKEAKREPATREERRERIGELRLEQAFERATQGHPEMTAARAAVEGARGDVVQAGLFPNPEAMLGQEGGRFRGRTTRDAEFFAGISQRLPMGGQRSAAVHVEKRMLHQRQIELEARKLEIRKGVHGAFATVLFQEKAAELSSDLVRTAEIAVGIARARLEAGDAIPNELSRAELALIRTRVERDRVISLRNRAMLALSAAMGDPTLQIDSVAGELDAVLNIPDLESLASRLKEHPRLAAAKADVSTQRAHLALAKVERIPAVNLEFLYRRIGESNADAFDVGLNMAIPLFDRNQGKLRSSRSAIAAAEARARSTRNALVREMRESRIRIIRALAAARKLRKDIVPRTEKILRIAEMRYKEGDVSLADILPVRRDWAATKLRYLEALRNVLAAWINLAPYLEKKPR